MKEINNLFSLFPIIKTELVTLRRIDQENDAADFFNYMNHPKVKEYLFDDDIPDSLEIAKKDLSYWAQLFYYKHGFYWAITKTNDNKIIGTCGFNLWNKSQRRAEISYDLDFNYWNQGYSTAAIKAICQFAFDEMKVARIQATVEITNKPSQRVLDKCGFINEGILRKFGILGGQSKDFFMFSLC